MGWFLGQENDYFSLMRVVRKWSNHAYCSVGKKLLLSLLSLFFCVSHNRILRQAKEVQLGVPSQVDNPPSEIRCFLLLCDVDSVAHAYIP